MAWALTPIETRGQMTAVGVTAGSFTVILALWRTRVGDVKFVVSNTWTEMA